MRKMFLSVFVIILFASAADAGPIGRAVARHRSWSLSGMASVEDNDFENRTLSQTGDLSSNIFFLDGGYAFTKDAEFYLRIGLSDDEFVRTGGPAGTFDFSSGALWGLGLRGTLYDSYEAWKIHGDAHYVARPSRDLNNAEIDIREFQAAVGVSVASGPFTPYGGFTGSLIDITSNNRTGFPEFKNEQSFGAYLGLGIEPYERWSGFIEGRFISGASASVGVQHRF